MTDLEQRLAALRDEVAWPPTPDLAAAVARARRRRAAARAGAGVATRPRGVGAPRRCACVRRPPSRSWRSPRRCSRRSPPRPACGRGSPTGSASAPCGSSASSACRTRPVRRARPGHAHDPRGRPPRPPACPSRRSRALGPPDAVYVDRRTGGGQRVARLSRAARAARRRREASARCSRCCPAATRCRQEAARLAGRRCESVDVDGGFGVFMSGDAHLVAPPNRLAGNTLLWVRGDTTYRLETALGRDAALRLARSVR